VILSDYHIARMLGLRYNDRPGLGDVAFQEGDLLIEPLDDPDVQLQPASVDLRLGPTIVRMLPSFGRVHADHGMRPDDVDVETSDGDDRVTIHAGEFVLGHTVERVRLPPYLCGRVEGRSSIGRLGVTMHVTAGFIDPGFDGQITLEIANLSRRHVTVPIGHRVCQLVLETMSCPVLRPYGSEELGSRYGGTQRGAVPYVNEDVP